MIEFRKEFFADERDDNLNEIGKPTRRQDILGHVTGRSPYFDDHLFEGLLHMRCARSPHHHARIRRIDKGEHLVKQGEAIYRGGVAAKGVPACAACHAPNGAGMPAQFPRIAGQHADYTVAQLKAFRGGQRTNDPAQMMRSTAAKMSDQEIAAVAEYIAGLR